MIDPYSHIPIDATGVRRSKKLTSMPGELIRLGAKIDRPGGLKRWQRRLDDPSTIIVLDLFCGAGGMGLGFQDAGGFVAAGVDQDHWAVMSHSYNFFSKGIVKDICNIPDPKAFLQELGIPRVDIIIGGPPCQGFALIGRPKLRSLGAEREAYYRNVINNLYREFVRFVLELQPLVFVMENVPAMASYKDEEGEILKRIEQAFTGYTVHPKSLNALHARVPQDRQRLFIQGNRIGMPLVWPTKKSRQHITVAQAINDLPERDPGMLSDEVLPYSANGNRTTYQKRMRRDMPTDHQDVVWDHITRQIRDDDKVIFAMMRQGDKYRDLPDEWKRYGQDNKKFSDKYSRLYEDKPSWTVTAHIAKDGYRYIHPTQNRTLSVREFARLQSFPDSFRFAGPRSARLRQIGNAVPPLLAQSIARGIVNQIKSYRATHAVSNDTLAEENNTNR